MNRKTIFLSICAAVVMVLAGVNYAYKQNQKMTGFNQIPRPAAVSLDGPKLEIEFLGTAYKTTLPKSQYIYYEQQAISFIRTGITQASLLAAQLRAEIRRAMDN